MKLSLSTIPLKYLLQFLQLIHEVVEKALTRRDSREEKQNGAWDRLMKAARNPKTTDGRLCTLVRRWASLAEVSFREFPLPDTLRRVFMRDPNPEHWLREYSKLQAYFAVDPRSGRNVLAHPIAIRQVTPHVLRFGAVGTLVAILSLQVLAINLGKHQHLDLWDRLLYFFVSMFLLVLAVHLADESNAHRRVGMIARWF